MDLSLISNDELRKEIERRKIAATKPKILDQYDLEKVKKLCKQYIDSLAGDEYFKDAEQHIAEAAIGAFYGATVWTWINSRIE